MTKTECPKCETRYDRKVNASSNGYEFCPRCEERYIFEVIWREKLDMNAERCYKE